MTLHRETEAVRNLILDFFDFITIKFHDLFAVLANDMVVVWMLGVIGIVEFVVLAEIHFTKQAALGEKRQCTINGSAGDRFVAGSGPFEKLLGGKMLLSAEYRLNDCVPLRRKAQVFLRQEINEAPFRALGFSICHACSISV